ncbi:MAG TPA: hypothetical protein VHE35_20070 [Kofleriaceae bacterium]|nr:hypothetical protein [Kofleriaceae bacterium]
MDEAPIRFAGRPERVFISVDERTGVSTLSFAPPGVADPIVRADDARGQQALQAARGIVATHAGCVIVGPHFHTSKPGGATKPRRRR